MKEKLIQKYVDMWMKGTHNIPFLIKNASK